MPADTQKTGRCVKLNVLATLACTSCTSKYRAKYRKTVQAFTVLHVSLEAPVMFRGLVGDAFQVHKMLGHH
jgi:hypothetical protein